MASQNTAGACLIEGSGYLCNTVLYEAGNIKTYNSNAHTSIAFAVHYCSKVTFNILIIIIWLFCRTFNLTSFAGKISIEAVLWYLLYIETDC